MNLVDFENQRKTLLLKKSKGNATEDDLKQLIRVLDLINKAEPSIVSEMNKKFVGQDDTKDKILLRGNIGDSDYCGY